MGENQEYGAKGTKEKHSIIYKSFNKMRIYSLRAYTHNILSTSIHEFGQA